MFLQEVALDPVVQFFNALKARPRTFRGLVFEPVMVFLFGARHRDVELGFQDKVLGLASKWWANVVDPVVRLFNVLKARPRTFRGLVFEPVMVFLFGARHERVEQRLRAVTLDPVVRRYNNLKGRFGG